MTVTTQHFDETQHPRDSRGQFATKPAAESSTTLEAPTADPVAFKAGSYTATLGKGARTTSTGALVRHKVETSVEDYEDGTPYGSRGLHREDHVVIEQQLHPGTEPGTYVTHGTSLRRPVHVSTGPDGRATFTHGPRPTTQQSTTWKIEGDALVMVDSDEWDVPTEGTSDPEGDLDQVHQEVTDAVEDCQGADDELAESMESEEVEWSRRVHRGPDGSPYSMVLEVRVERDLDD